MQAADLFVILDDVQYTKGNFQNRNKFLNSNGIEEWFTVELERHANKKLINEIYVSDNMQWKIKIIKKLQQNFHVDMSKIYQYEKLIDINIASIQYCKDKLNITTPIVYSSSLNINSVSSQRLAEICKQLNATEYISGIGGKQYLDENIFTCPVTYFVPDVKNYYTTLQYIL